MAYTLLVGLSLVFFIWFMVNWAVDKIWNKLEKIAHDAQQIKTGDEWSKKREHEIINKLDKIIKVLEKQRIWEK
jgi:KaiC/GvpD/RAD55 family RecA-like ATPase